MLCLGSSLGPPRPLQMHRARSAIAPSASLEHKKRVPVHPSIRTLLQDPFRDQVVWVHTLPNKNKSETLISKHTFLSGVWEGEGEGFCAANRVPPFPILAKHTFDKEPSQRFTAQCEGVGTFENCPWPPDYEVYPRTRVRRTEGKPQSFDMHATQSFQHVEGGTRSQIPCTHGTSGSN